MALELRPENVKIGKPTQDPLHPKRGLFLWRKDMTKLPAKELLDGKKIPETTTGEFRLAMGNIRQFLFELFGDESSDKETARQTLGIDLTQLNEDISKKADAKLVDGVVKELASDVVELANNMAKLTSEVASIVVAPVGTIYVQFAGQSAPADLYGGTWENISAQFAGQFFRAEGGSAAAFGSSQGAGLPNVWGEFLSPYWSIRGWSGAFEGYASGGISSASSDGGGNEANTAYNFYGSRCSGYYGASDEPRPYNSTIRIWKRIA